MNSQKYMRFTRSERIEHWAFMASFTTLALTGLVQKFAQNPLSRGVVFGLGGVENIRLIHHAAATIMMIVAVFHVGAAGYRVYVNRRRFSILPSLQDLRNGLLAFSYFVGRRKSPPQQGRYTYEEKVEYWAVVWGTLIMVITGFMMWNPIATTRLLPGQLIPAAKAAHGAEAILAVLAILLWHMYQVVVKHINRSMYNGHLTEEEMLEEHPLELADIKAGLTPPQVTPEGMTKRRRKYVPVYGAIALALTLGIIYFVTFEETAIATVPPAEQAEVFVPLTPTPLPTPPPSPVPAEVTVLTWEGGVGELFGSKCVACHNSTSLIGGLDLSTFQAAITGGADGLVIVPGDSGNSQLIAIQTAGGHPGQFSDEELDLVQQWIEAGAQE
jgi:formate dehydrogenase gamma subunit